MNRRSIVVLALFLVVGMWIFRVWFMDFPSVEVVPAVKVKTPSISQNSAVAPTAGLANGQPAAAVGSSAGFTSVGDRSKSAVGQPPVPADAGAHSSGGSTPASFHFGPGPANGESLVFAAFSRPPSHLTSTLQLWPAIAAYKMAFGQDLSQASPSGFFYLAYDSGKLVAGADMTGPDARGAYRVFHFATDPPYAGGQSVAVGLERLTANKAFNAGAYELRLLRMPAPKIGGAQIWILWLKADAGGTDLFFPLPTGGTQPLPNGMEVWHLYSADEFQKIVRPPPKMSP